MRLRGHVNRGRTLAATSITLLVSLLVATAAAEEPPGGLFGDPGGVRSALSERGVELDAVLTSDAVGNVWGGIERGVATLYNVDLLASMDTEKAVGIPGGKLFLYGLADFGEQPSRFVGELQTTDNIQAPKAAKLYEAWYDQALDDRTSVLVGLHDYNSEFDALEYASGLLNSSFGIGVDIAQAGPSIFPTTSVAVRVVTRPSDHSYVRLAAYDGVPGNANDPRGTQVKLGGDDGAFLAGEVGAVALEGERYFKAALGSWYHTTDYEDFEAIERRGNYGFYLEGERLLLAEEDPQQGLGAFVRVGSADPHGNKVGELFSAGVRAIGLIPGRDEDALNVGTALARSTDQFRTSENAERVEEILELNYRIVVRSYLSVVPGAQLVLNPSMDPNKQDALLLYLRTVISL